MIALREQEYYVPGLPKYLRIIFLQGIHASEGHKGDFIACCHDEHDIYVKHNSPQAPQSLSCQKNIMLKSVCSARD